MRPEDNPVYVGRKPVNAKEVSGQKKGGGSNDIYAKGDWGQIFSTQKHVYFCGVMNLSTLVPLSVTFWARISV